VQDHYPQTCGCCGEKLTGFDPNPIVIKWWIFPPFNSRLKSIGCTNSSALIVVRKPELVYLKR
jgi:hypothetical protein